MLYARVDALGNADAQALFGAGAVERGRLELGGSRGSLVASLVAFERAAAMRKTDKR